MASLYDVAKRAGVSKTLVSRVISNKGGVSPQSREKILAAMKELQYMPNALARSLVLKKTYTIGVVLDSLCEPYFFDLINGIEQEVSNTDYNVIFSSGHSYANLKNRYINYMFQGRVDGVIIYGSRLDDENLIRQLAEVNFPAVIAENDLGDLNINNIVVDNELGSQMAVDHLMECGCRSIYYLIGDTGTKAAIERCEGYKKAMKNHGIDVEEHMLLNAGFGVKQGYCTVSEWIRKNGVKALPDAFYCGADNTAFGAMMALEDAGISVPDQVMLVGFDDDRPINVDRPLKKLTTLSQPLYEIGVSAVQILLNEIEQKNEEKQRKVYSPKLIVRETTRKKT